MKAREAIFVAFDTEHPLVTQLVPEVGQLPELITLQGFVGRSGRAGYCRVYTDIRMTGYVEFPGEYVRAVAVLPVTTVNPWSPNVVWLEARRLGDERPDDVLVGGRLAQVGTRDLGVLWAEFGADAPSAQRQGVASSGITEGAGRRPVVEPGGHNTTGGTGSVPTGPPTKFSPP